MRTLAALLVGLAAPLGVQAGTTFECAPPPQGPGAARPATASARHLGLPTRGVANVVTIFARFDGEAAGAAAPAWAGGLFDPDLPGSVAHFYREMSLGRLQVRGEVLPRRYASQQPAAAYLTTQDTRYGDYGVFAAQVLAQADADVDFGRFDNDGADGVPNSGDDDGFVDYVSINLISVPRRFIYGRATGIADLGIDGDFVTDDAAAAGGFVRISGQSRYGSVQQERGYAFTAGSMAHEFGHALGLDDLYDHRYDVYDPSTDSGGIGNWGLMGWGTDGWYGDDGPNPLSAWSRVRLGWLATEDGRLVEVRRDTTVRIDDVASGGAVVRVPLPPEPKASSVEEGYLLLEQRQRGASHYHRNQPGDGLLVWHVRPSERSNFEERSKRVDLVCADGRYADAGFPGLLAQRHDGGDNLDFWAHDEPYRSRHHGNLGDATDLFDGVTYTRLEAQTNPSSLPSAALAGATTGTTLRVRRQGAASVVEIGLPRWRGTIGAEVRWIGDILVDGDLEVLPGGALIVYPGTQVRFAGSDARHTGLDPERIELTVRGRLEVQLDPATILGRFPTPAVFAAATPGDSWYGIVTDGSSYSVRMPEGSVALRDAAQGVQLPGAPAGVSGLVVGQVSILDDAADGRAGNGDGVLNPGETVALQLRLDNWTLTSEAGVTGVVSWTSDLLQVRPGAAAAAGGRLTSARVSLDPGQQRAVVLPEVTVSAAAGEGDRLQVLVEVRAGRTVYSERLDLPVHGSYPRHTARLEVAQSGMAAGAVVAAGRAAQVTARVEGDVAAAELVVRDRQEGRVLQAVPMARQVAAGATRIFAADFTPPADGSYDLGLRVRSAAGAAVFSPVVLPLAAVPDPQDHAVLLLLEEVSPADRSAIRRPLLAALPDDAGGVASMEMTGLDSLWFAGLLAAYRAADRAVVWGGTQLPLSHLRAVGEHVRAGGRTMLVSLSLGQSTDFQAVLGEAFGVGGMASIGFSALAVAPGGASGAGAEALFRPLVARAGAQALLVDRSGRPAAVLTTAAGGPAAYLAFRPAPAVAGLIAQALQVLRAASVGPPSPLGPGPGADPVAPFEPGIAFEPVPLPQETRFGNGASLFDVDGDGDLDLYLIRLGVADQLFRNDGAAFVEAAAAAGLDDAGSGRAAALGDVDGDGDLDVYLVRQGANRLLANDGGRFREVTAAAGLSGPAGLADPGSGRSAIFFDADTDGDLDLYVVNAGGTNRFYERRHGLYFDRTQVRGLADAHDGRGVAAGDIDADGDTDLFLANYDGPSALLSNDRGTFTRQATAMPLLPGGEVAAVLGDYDNDGDPDLFLSNERFDNQLLRNDGRTFRAVAGGGRLGRRTVGAAFGDYDNDGDLDLVTTALLSTAEGDRIYENRGGAFTARDADLGLAGRSQGRAVVLADVDGDGRQDLAVADYGGSRLYRNRIGEGHWLQLDLQDEGDNRHGLGARVELRVGAQVQVREAQSGFGYGSQVQPRLHFGLGAAPNVDQVTVTWPDGRVDTWHDLGADRVVGLARGALPAPVGKGTGAGTPDQEPGLRVWPNPANAGVTIACTLPSGEAAQVTVYDLLGQAVREWRLAAPAAGAVQLRWDGRDAAGRPVGSGVYLVRVRTAGAVHGARLLLLQ